MINARVIELLKSPREIKEQDLKLVSKEIAKYPYVQSLRALYLLGTHMHNAQKYPSVLHTTAAYTTDKKILYHFINRQASASEAKQEEQKLVSDEPSKEKSTSSFETVLPKEKQTLAVVYVNGERNRILFEGEEDFLSQQTPKIDWEQTEEAGKLTSLAPEQIPVSNSKEPEIEKIDKEAQISSVESVKELEKENTPEPIESENSTADLSFQGVDSFLPEVSIGAKENTSAFLPKQSTDRHQDEMQRLIAEVEAKIKAKKKATQAPKSEDDSPIESNEINFSQVSQFEFSNAKEIEEEKKQDSLTEQEPTSKSTISPVSTPREGWKPMVFPTGPSPIKSKEKPSEQMQKSTHDSPEAKEEAHEIVEIEEQVKLGISTPKQDNAPEPLENSNIPEFINTWQSWLKIDRTQEPTEKSTLLSIDQVRNRAIDMFIENEPKISKLKEESSFVIREKPDDISHLMTETLVGLYVEQRLYSKAIQGYEVLQEKHPEKRSEYEEKIEEIKARTGK